ncbi:MAG: magnetosome protein MamI [Alphaproteobacteria bacterium]
MPWIVVGLLALALGLWGMSVWWWSVVDLLRGVMPIVLIVVGVLALAVGVTAAKTEKETKDEGFLGDEG